MIRNVLFAAAVAATPVLFAAPALAQPTEAAFRTTTLNLSAQGQVKTRPEIVTLMLGAEHEAETAAAAVAEANLRINGAVAALRKAGVAERDIQTQYVQLYPRYSDTGKPERIVAYRASTAISAVVRRPERAGEMLDIALAAGANRMHGVRYGLADPGVAQREARDVALRALQQDAARIADQMGLRVVRVVNVGAQAWRQGSGGAEEVVVTASRINTQIAPGELAVYAHVNGVFELAPK